jgi:serine/threonine protein kinase
VVWSTANTGGRNTTLQNILVARPGPNWHVKLADFGICRQLKLVAFARRHEGTVSYVAPEYTYVNYHLGDRPYLPGNQPEYSPAMDVWALGGVVYMVRAGHPPFNSDEEVDAYMEDSAPNFPTDPLRAVSEGCVKFIRRAMAGDEDARPTVAELLEDSWLGSFEGLDGSIRDG